MPAAVLQSLFLLVIVLSTAGTISITRLRRADISSVARLVVGEFFDPTTASSKTLALERRAVCARLEQHIGRTKHTSYFIAKDTATDDDVVGFVEVAMTADLAAAFAHEGIPPRPCRPKLTALTVAPSHRRRGIGTLLLAACARQSEAWLQLPRGGAELWLEVRRDNAPARKLYYAAGFVECPVASVAAFGTAESSCRDLMLYYYGPGTTAPP